MLGGKREELPHILRPDGSHSLDHSLDDGAEHFVGAEVERRLRQAGIAPEKHRRAQQLEPIDGSREQIADDGLGRGAAVQSPQLDEVLLYDGSGVIIGHGKIIRDYGVRAMNLRCLSHPLSAPPA